MKLHIFIVLLLLASCGERNSKTVKPLSEKQRNEISKSLQNQNLPSPNEIEDGTIAYDDQCTEFKKNIPEDWFSGSLLVPENPEDPTGRKISIFYYGKIEPNKTPVVFFNGGPATSSWNSFFYFKRYKLMVDPAEKVSLIYIDQRGTGCSSYYPQGSEGEVLERLRYYGTRGIVADAEAVRKHLLGDKKWIAFGQSYGSFINHRYTILAPESLKAIFSHASVLSEDPKVRLLQRIKSQDRVLKSYLEKYPDDKERFEAFNRLSMNDCYTSESGNSKYCGYRLVYDVLSFLGWTSDWNALHSWLVYIMPEDKIDDARFKDYLAAFVFTAENMTPINSSQYANLVISWVDRGVSWIDVSSCNEIANQLLTEGLDIRKNAITECAVFLQMQDSHEDSYRLVRHLKRDLMSIPMLKTSLEKNLQLPFYLYSGSLDPYVPVESFADEVASLGPLSNFKYKDFLTSGHNGFRIEPELWDSLIYEVER